MKPNDELSDFLTMITNTIVLLILGSIIIACFIALYYCVLYITGGKRMPTLLLYTAVAGTLLLIFAYIDQPLWVML